MDPSYRRTASAGRTIALRSWAGALLGLTLFASPVRGEDRILTLAIVNYQSLLSPQFHNLKVLSPRETPAAPAFQPEEKLAVSARLFLQAGTSVPSTSLSSERKFQPERANLHGLTRNLVQVSTFPRIWGRVEAGYGLVFRDHSALVYSHHGTAWEEPGYGYLKIHFRF